jgi:serine protease inhibitor
MSRISGKSRKSRVGLVCVVCCVVCLSCLQCSDSVCPTQEDPPRDLSATEQQVVNAYNAFGLHLFQEIAAGSKDDNIFISPVSVSMALGMTMNGAAGATLDSMRSALEFGDMTLEEIDQCYRSLIDLVVGLDPEVEFGIGNSIWYRVGLPVRQEFVAACQDYFDAEVTDLDFADPASADAINDWVKAETHDRIDQIVGKPVNPAIVMYLINAIYFKGTWTYQFDPALTEDSQFARPDGSKAPCKMMTQPEPGETSEYRYLEDEALEAIDLPYADGWFSMTVLLPREGKDVDQVIADLGGDQWAALLGRFADKKGTIAMPRFTLEYEKRLNDVLAALGMAVALTPDADFSAMVEGGGLWIDEVKHKTFVQVNEEGTEAAAVTSVGMTDAMPDAFAMRVDRPFVFVIRERHSGTVLFIGRITDPGNQ